MKIFIGSDHGGFPVKATLIPFLENLGHSVTNCGTHSEGRCDFPDFAQAVAQNVVSSLGSRGILLCKTGVGMAIAANRFRGIRAALCYNEENVQLARHHDDINVLCLATIQTSPEEIEKIVAIFLNAPFDSVERRVRRMKKLDEL